MSPKYDQIVFAPIGRTLWSYLRSFFDVSVGNAIDQSPILVCIIKRNPASIFGSLEEHQDDVRLP